MRLKMASDLLLFTCPKEETDPHIARIQANARYSWQQLGPLVHAVSWYEDSKAFLFNTVASTKNTYGTPLVNVIFSIMEVMFWMIPYHLYTNADIMYRGDILQAFRALQGWNNNRWLMVGRRWDIDMDHDIDTPETLQSAWDLPATWHQPAGMDYFLYPTGTFDFSTWPAFALGRFRWDNWIVWHALHQGIPVIDASLAVTPLHQNHGYGHFSPHAQAEIEENGRLARASGLDKWCTTDDATHYLDKEFMLHGRTNS
jgi:GNAT superfamily N-acetyltransferase